jgi:hypothetical protein
MLLLLVSAARKCPLSFPAILVLIFGGSVGCRQEPLPLPSPPQRAADGAPFDGPPPRLRWNIVERKEFGRPNALLMLRNVDSFPWTMLDQIRLSIVTPNMPYIPRRRGSSEHWIELRCSPPPSVPPGGLLVIVYEMCDAPWEGFYDGSVKTRPGNRPDDPDARAWSLRLVAREGVLEVRLGEGPGSYSPNR